MLNFFLKNFSLPICYMLKFFLKIFCVEKKFKFFKKIANYEIKNKKIKKLHVTNITKFLEYIYKRGSGSPEQHPSPTESSSAKAGGSQMNQSFCVGLVALSASLPPRWSLTFSLKVPVP